ncbi:hypothetical protein PENSPDRAFT_666368 [Peniophora sp. CONT]|nr:hypothetical protein PENSPDRAFT_666368 [Peniophora sp. CONT]
MPALNTGSRTHARSSSLAFHACYRLYHVRICLLDGRSRQFKELISNAFEVQSMHLNLHTRPLRDDALRGVVAQSLCCMQSFRDEQGVVVYQWPIQPLFRSNRSPQPRVLEMTVQAVFDPVRTSPDSKRGMHSRAEAYQAEGVQGGFYEPKSVVHPDALSELDLSLRWTGQSKFPYPLDLSATTLYTHSVDRSMKGSSQTTSELAASMVVRATDELLGNLTYTPPVPHASGELIHSRGASSSICTSHTTHVRTISLLRIPTRDPKKAGTAGLQD